MKTMKFISAILVAFLISSCSTEYTPSTCTVFVIDKTNHEHHKRTLFPFPHEIDAFFQNINPQNSREFWITEISEVSMNNLYKYKLPAQCIWENPHNRKDSLESFYKNVSGALNEVIGDFDIQSESSIYLSLCYLFSSINKVDAERKNVLLYSDLLENSSMTTSFYKSPPRGNDYEEVLKRLEGVARMPNLTGINIVVVYKPTKQTDKLFYHAKHFWKRLVTEKGGTITFIANL